MLSFLAKNKQNKNKEVWCLTVSGDFIGRVEPPVPTRRCADVHVEMDVVSQPVATLLVPHKYRLLPVLRPFTSVVKKGKRQTTSTRETDEKGSTIHHSIRNRFPLFLSNDRVRQRGREMDIGSLSDHSPFCCCHTHSWTLIRLSKCPEETGRVYLWSIHALHLNRESVIMKVNL